MALPAWQATIVNSVGDIIPSAEITVLIEATGLPATLFSDRAGTVPLGTLGVFPANVDGFAQFYAAPAEYRITAEDSGSGFTQTWRYVVLSGTAATSNTQTSSTDLTIGALMAVGAGGLLSSSTPVISDLDSIDFTVISRYATSTGGSPPFDFANTFTQVYGAGSRTQLITEIGTTGGGIAWRQMVSGVYQSWRLIYDGTFPFQPDVSYGIGVTRQMVWANGGAFVDGAITSGANLRSFTTDLAGAVTQSASGPSGTWKLVQGDDIVGVVVSTWTRIT